MKSTKSKEVERSSKWICVTCDQKEPCEHEEMMTHLKEIHQIETKGLKVQKKMLMHMDGDTWFSSDYEMIIPSKAGAIKVLNSIMCPRAKDDMMRYC